MNLTDLDPNILNTIAQTSLSPVDFSNLRHTCRTLRRSLSRSLYARHWLKNHNWEVSVPVSGSMMINWMRTIHTFFMEDPSRNVPPQNGSILIKTRKHLYSIVFRGTTVAICKDAEKAYILKSDSFMKTPEMIFSGAYSVAYTRLDNVNDEGDEQDFIEYPHYFTIGPLRYQLRGVVSMITTKYNLFAYRFNIDAFKRQLAEIGHNICI